MTDYKTIATNVIPEITEARLYDDTVEKVKRDHREIPAELPSIQVAVTSAVTNPSRVERGRGRSYVYVDEESTNASGDPLRVPVKPVAGTSGRVQSFYFASTTGERDIVYRRSDVED